MRQPGSPILLSGDHLAIRYTVLRCDPEPVAEAILERASTGGLRGRIASIRAEHSERATVDLEFPAELVGAEIPHLLALLLDPVSELDGVRIERFDLPPELVSQYPGPRYGSAGLERRADRDALSLVTLGTDDPSPRALAQQAYRQALAGIDMILDDPRIANQTYSSFEDRAYLCAEAVQRANRDTGRCSSYVPNVTGPSGEVMRRARFAFEAGAGGIMVLPALVGFDALKRLADDESLRLPVFSHSLGLGRLAGAGGVAPLLLYGQLPRLAGADCTVHPYVTRTRQDVVTDIRRGCSEPLGHLREILGVVGCDDTSGEARRHSVVSPAGEANPDPGAGSSERDSIGRTETPPTEAAYLYA